MPPADAMTPQEEQRKMEEHLRRIIHAQQEDAERQLRYHGDRIDTLIKERNAAQDALAEAQEKNERLKAASYVSKHGSDGLWPKIHSLTAALAASDRALLEAWTGWSFGGIDGQQHTHNWHDREDWCERHAAAIASARARAQEAT